MKKVLCVLFAVMMFVSFGTLSIAEEEIKEVAAEVVEAVEAAPVVEEAAPVAEELIEEEPEEDPMAVIELPEDMPVAFTGKISVSMQFDGEELYYGDTVTLRANVKDANLPYSIRWESGVNDQWNTIGSGSSYSFTVNEQNAVLAYRAVLVVD